VAVLKSPLGGCITALGKGATNLLPTPADGLRCPSCGGTLKDPRATGLRMLRRLDTHLRTRCGASMIESTRRRAPPRRRRGTDPRHRLDLKDQLRRAVENENFELAADLRDRIRVLE
jgi:protein arginine kinase activator